MTAGRVAVAALTAVLACAAFAARASAQCRPPASSHEARLLAFYEAPTAFSLVGAPERLAHGAAGPFACESVDGKAYCSNRRKTIRL